MISIKSIIKKDVVKGKKDVGKQLTSRIDMLIKHCCNFFQAFFICFMPTFVDCMFYELVSGNAVCACGVVNDDDDVRVFMYLSTRR